MTDGRRRTKIVASIGPASESPRVLAKLMHAGMDVARINLSHGSLESSLDLYERIRRVAREEQRQLGVLADLPGPKIRIAPLPRGGTMLEQDAPVVLRIGKTASDAGCLEVDYEGLLEDVQPGDRVGLADGQVLIEIHSERGGELHGQVLHGGLLRGRPGFYIPAGRLSLDTPTERDLRYAEAFVQAGVDFIGISFVRSAEDLARLGTEPAPSGPLLVAKIETRPAVENIDSIIRAADAVMVARGDLGIELPIEDLPHLQKDIIRRCIAGGRPAITATQMLESMTESPVPTRAEASDVANAVFDGSSAVMLSAETAIGANPVHVVSTMARIAQEADLRFDHTGWTQKITQLHMINPDKSSLSISDAMTTAASRVLEEVDLAALICVSGSGFTVRSMARFRPRVPVLGFSVDPRTVRQLTLSWGVEPICLASEVAYESRVADAVEAAAELGRVRAGDLVATLAGINPATRSTDVLRLVRVPEDLRELRHAPQPHADEPR
ncbi:MAG: pyruvate kinase [Acidimicrobiia bacterium]|nr:pyruvate kinase [Acidimicrobiia bacterium]MYE67416.1 pyruvate kinase [Acidimicrobiia bacterium]MYJ14765.1 pyruvate kinase [Acidimicrobiia bacterium]